MEMKRVGTPPESQWKTDKQWDKRQYAAVLPNGSTKRFGILRILLIFSVVVYMMMGNVATLLRGLAFVVASIQRAIVGSSSSVAPDSLRASIQNVTMDYTQVRTRSADS